MRHASCVRGLRLPPPGIGNKLHGQAAVMTADAEPIEGKLLGPYRIGAKLQEGGMGQVFAAVHERLGRRVAIKVLHPHCAKDEELVRRFFNEARAVNMIEHAGLIQVHDFDRLPDGTAYLVMELLRGESLSARLEKNPHGLPEDEVVWLGWQIADTVAAVHENDIVHRDLKPNNVMLFRDSVDGSERTKVLDFGIAKLGEELLLPGQRATSTNVMIGTLLYIAPEQCRSARRVDGKADVYSLGIMLYEMLSGNPPFLGDSEVALITMHLHDEPRPLSEVAPRLATQLASLVHSMLKKDRAARPSMREVATALRTLTQQTPSRAITPRNPELEPAELGFVKTLAAPVDAALQKPPRSWMRPMLGVFALGLVSTLALSLGMQLGMRQERHAAERRGPVGVATPRPTPLPSTPEPVAVSAAGTVDPAAKSAESLPTHAPTASVPKSISPPLAERRNGSTAGVKIPTHPAPKAHLSGSNPGQPVDHDSTPTVDD